jgi:hypothetical protein
MKIINIKSLSSLLIISMGLILFSLINGCKASQQVSAKTGVQLWAENCQRCHNTPSPNSFSHDQWETIGMHMQSRALLTEDERIKIVGFLQQ